MKTNPVKKVNVAVVGLGFMGVTHLRAYLAAESAQVVAVCDAVRLPVNGILRGVVGNVKTATNDIDLGPKVKVCRALEEVLADPEVELVDICTPTPLHPQQAVAALKAGKHVLCEKPLARTSAAAREILQATTSARGFLMPAMCMRFWPGWSWLKQMAAEQTYGNILAARFRRVSEMPRWSAGTYTGAMDIGGALFDLHIHDTDFVNFLFGRPTAVFSTGVVGASGFRGPCRDAIYLSRRAGGLRRRRLAAHAGIQHVLHHPLRTRHAGLRFGPGSRRHAGFRTGTTPAHPPV